jgi:hypothetical protein
MPITLQLCLYAVMDTNKSIEIHINNDNNLGMSSIFDHQTSNISFTIEAYSLDSIEEIQQLRRIDVIKIDIEGAEWYALQGMKNTLHRFKPVLLIELIPEFLEKIPIQLYQIVQRIEEVGYTIHQLDSNGRIIHISNLYDSSLQGNFIFLPKSPSNI